MLSVERHLLFLFENEQKQIPPFARDDVVDVFFISLVNYPSSCRRAEPPAARQEPPEQLPAPPVALSHLA